MDLLLEITSKQFRMPETVLKLASDEEIRQLRTICQNIADRARGAREVGEHDRI